MNKDEILKKSRAEKEDEGTVYVNNNGHRFGMIGFCSVFVIIILFNIFTKQNNFVPFSMFWAYASAEAYGKYRITKTSTLMLTTIFAAIASICFLACYVLEVLEISA